MHVSRLVRGCSLSQTTLKGLLDNLNHNNIWVKRPRGPRALVYPWWLDSHSLPVMATTDRDLHHTSTNAKTSVMRSPVADRNKEPLLKVLIEHVPKEGPLQALEIASGTGQHAVYFAEHLPQITWQPTECDENSLRSIVGYIQAKHMENVLQPLYVNTTSAPEKWADGALSDKQGTFDIVLCINMVHISEWESSVGLFQGCGYYLKTGGLLFSYGPYKVYGKMEPESNVRFDAMLKQQNASWGLRDVEDLEKLGTENSMKLEHMIDMPANNKVLIFKKI